jgi:hypothetical protein
MAQSRFQPLPNIGQQRPSNDQTSVTAVRKVISI